MFGVVAESGLLRTPAKGVGAVIPSPEGSNPSRSAKSESVIA